jgi:peptidoglycan/LPS O-acetylase OafA/YrhL
MVSRRPYLDSFGTIHESRYGVRFMRISTLASGRDNNFNLIRAIAASAVLVSHAFPLAGVPGEPLESWAPANLGRLAVAVFFSISGFFIAKSFDRRSSLIEFTVDRVLRIYPALFVVLVLTAFVVGPCFTRLHLGVYFSSKDTWRYVPDSLTRSGCATFCPEFLNIIPVRR